MYNIIIYLFIKDVHFYSVAPEEMEQVEVLKEYRSIDISLDEFLEMMRNYKKERQSEKKMKEPENSKEVEENREKIMEDKNEGN